MLDVTILRDNPDSVRDALDKRGMAEQYDMDAIMALDERYRALLQEVEELRRVRNETSEAVARAKQEGNDERAEQLIASMAEVKEALHKLEDDLRSAADERERELFRLPNIPFDDVPVGKDESDNVVVREVGEKPSFPFEPRDHMQLGETLDVIDVERAAKVSGARFYYLKGDAALLEFALVQYVYQTLLAENFIPIIPPVMIREEHFRGMGRLAPGDEEERYYLPKDDLYLVASAEHTMGPLHAGETFGAGTLPRRYVGFSPCFRREAGSYGKDTRGILRVHQFDKVEMFVYAEPGQSRDEHTFLVAMQEKLMRGLGLPYRVVEICTGDMGFTDAKQYDVEVWLPGQERGVWKESHSASNTTDFQARGEEIKVTTEEGTVYAHMLNATALAMSRTIVAIMENYQQEDGSIVVPEVLHPWMAGRERIEKTA